MSISQGREVSNVAAECLLFAIYYSTVISISAAECREELDEEKPVLLQRFVGCSSSPLLPLLEFIIFHPLLEVIDQFQIPSRNRAIPRTGQLPEFSKHNRIAGICHILGNNSFQWGNASRLS